jgi:WD40 repeat protein
MENRRTIKVFLSSPGDVALEREAGNRVIARVGGIYQKHIIFRLERWEAHFYEATRSFQEGIAAMDTFDLVIGILWKRIGTELPPGKFRRPDGSAFESGTVYEIESALAAYKAQPNGPSVYVFRKTEPVLYTAAGVDEERRQKETLDDWWARSFRDSEGRYIAGANNFDTVDAFENQLENLLIIWLQTKGYIPAGPIWDSEKLGRSPYPGLVAYDHDRAQVFFGRGYAIQEAREQLLAAGDMPNRAPVLFVIGASGSGKSSLVRAGLIPLLITPGAGPRIDVWRTAVTEPSTQSIQTLADRLYAAIPELASGAQRTPSKWAELAQSSPAAAADALTWALAAVADIERQRIRAKSSTSAGLLLLVDQLESIFGSSEQEVFSRLIEALVVNGSVWLIVTMRSDRYAELQQDSHFLRLKRSGVTYDLPSPGPAEINDIIKGPARAAGLVFSERDGISLIETLKVATPNADALPLLQMTLAQLFESKQGNVLTHSAYDAIGGIEGAIAAHANAIFREMPIASEKELSAVLSDLVRDVSRRADGSIRFTAQRVQKSRFANRRARKDLVDSLVDGRLLVSDGETVRLAHEALLRRWGPAAQVLERIADAEIRRSRLRAAFAVASASVFLCVATIAILLYERSNGNLALALRARADQFIADDMPTRAFVLATKASYSFLAPLRSLLAGTESEESIKLDSIVQVARSAASTPEVLLTAPAAASAVDASEDGKWVVVGYASGDVKLLRPDGQVINLSLNKGPILTVKFSPAFDRIFIATDTSIYSWEKETEELDILCTGGAELTDVTVSRTANLLAWTAKDKGTNLLDLKTGAKRRFEDHANWVLSVAMSADGKRIASVGDDALVVVRATREAVETVSFTSGQKDIWSVALSPDGTYLATASISGKVAIWRVDGTERNPSPRELPMPPDRRWKVSFSPDGKAIAVASWGGTVTLFDPIDAQHLGTIDGHDQRVNDIVFVPRTERLITASNSGSVKSWKSSHIKSMFFNQPTGAPEIIAASYNSDGTQFLAGGNDGVARLYDVRPEGSLRLRCSVNAGGWIRGVAFVRGSNRAIALRASEGSRNNEPVITVFSAETCQIQYLNNLQAAGDVTSIAASSSSENLVWGTGTGQIFQYDVRRQDPPGLIELPSAAAITDISFDAGGKRLAAGSALGKVYLVDLESQALRELTGPAQYVGSVKFSPDSRLVAAGGRDENIYLWDITNTGGQRPTTLKIPGGTNYLAFSTDGKLLAAGSDALYLAIWSVTDWKKVFLLHKHVGIRSVYGFHPTRRDLAFDGSNGVIRVLPNQANATIAEPYGTVSGVEPIFDRERAVHRPEMRWQARFSDRFKCDASGSLVR